MKRKKTQKTKRRAVNDLMTRKAGSKVKGGGPGAGKVNVQDLSFTH